MAYTYKLTEKAKSLPCILVQHLTDGDYLLNFQSWQDAVKSQNKRIDPNATHGFLAGDDGTIEEYTDDDCLDATENGFTWPLDLGLVKLINIEE
jgi:hypothetical protein